MLSKVEQQNNIEQIYSRRNVRALVKDDVDVDHVVVQEMIRLIHQYRIGVNSHYMSKNQRIAYLDGKFTNEELAIEILTAVLPVKEVSPIQSVATQIAITLDYSDIVDGVKTASELLAVTEASSAFTIYHSTDPVNDTGTLSIRSHFSLDAELINIINRTKYLPPMICAPLDWTTNSNGGNLQGSGSCILGSMNHHDGNQSLDVLNLLQVIPWQMNELVDYVESSNKALDTEDKINQFNTMRDQSTVVYDELMEEGNKFFFPWKNDCRGRMYSQGYHLHLQSTQYKKAILDFYNEELIT